MLYEYFIEPILRNGWFNPVNTLTWAIILIAGVFAVYRLILRPLGIRIDRRFFLAILPFIFWASSTRVLRDLAVALAGTLSNDIVRQGIQLHAGISSYISGLIPSQGFSGFYAWVITLFPTPGSYVITFVFALITLLIALGIQKLTKGKIPYYKFMFLAGAVFSALNIYLLPFRFFQPFAVVIFLALLWTGLFWIIRPVSKKLNQKSVFSFFRPENLGILSAHFLDAAATFTALSFYGYLEQHFIPRMLFPAMGPAGMFLLKIAVVLPVLYIIDRYGEKGDFNNFLKIVIVILGLAPGLRDMLRLMVGV